MVGVPSSRSRFQSTLPLRGATHGGMGFTTNGKISIHTPLAGSDVIAEDVTCVLGDISIHTPLAGSDRRLLPGWNFQYISIHTPLAGSDVEMVLRQIPTIDFNPHSPCGERPAGQTILEGLVEFQSTLPLRGATSPKSFTLVSLEFQSTLPLRGATLVVSNISSQQKFQSTLPLRGATAEMRHF